MVNIKAHSRWLGSLFAVDHALVFFLSLLLFVIACMHTKGVARARNRKKWYLSYFSLLTVATTFIVHRDSTFVLSFENHIHTTLSLSLSIALSLARSTFCQHRVSLLCSSSSSSLPLFLLFLVVISIKYDTCGDCGLLVQKRSLDVAKVKVSQSRLHKEEGCVHQMTAGHVCHENKPSRMRFISVGRNGESGRKTPLCS